MINEIAEDFENIVAVAKSKELKQYVKNILPNLKKWKTQLEIKPIKIGNRPGTTYCLECKDFTHNFRSQEVKMTKYLEKNQTVLFVSQISQGF